MSNMASERPISSGISCPINWILIFPNRWKSDGEISDEYGGTLISSAGYVQKSFVSSLHYVGLHCRHEPLISFRLDVVHLEKIYQSMVANFDLWTKALWMAAVLVGSLQYETHQDPMKLSTCFSGRQSSCLSLRSIIIHCCSDTLASIFVIEPVLVARHDIMTSIVRVCSELRQYLQT
jgi:hypothetical protein